MAQWNWLAERTKPLQPYRNTEEKEKVDFVTYVVYRRVADFQNLR